MLVDWAALPAILQVYHFQIIPLDYFSQAYLDIILVRMTSDLIRSPEKRYNYSNALAGLVHLVKEEGTLGLFRGLGTNTVCRNF